MRVVLPVLAALAGLTVAAGYGGRWVAASDLLTLIRVPAAISLLVLGAVLPGWWKVPAVGMAVVVLVAWALPRFSGGEGTADLTLYQKNVLFSNRMIDELAADIRESGADVVTLQEIGSNMTKLLNRLKDAYPTQVSCRKEWRNTPAVLSRLPHAGEEFCDETTRVAALQVESDRGPVWVASVHLGYPWPAGEQFSQARKIAVMLEALDGPVIVGGDFNNLPWSGAVARVSEAAGGKPLGPWRPTRWVPLWSLLKRAAVEDYKPEAAQHAGWIPIAIDHVVAPGGRLERRPLLGSDHMGVLAQVMLGPRGDAD